MEIRCLLKVFVYTGIFYIKDTNHVPQSIYQQAKDFSGSFMIYQVLPCHLFALFLSITFSHAQIIGQVTINYWFLWVSLCDGNPYTAHNLQLDIFLIGQ